VGGPSGSGKTALVEAILATGDPPVLAARCLRDDGLRRPRESSPRTHAELRRYLQAAAYAAAVYAFPGQVADPISFYETDLMLNYSKAVILEGDEPLGYVDLELHVWRLTWPSPTVDSRTTETVACGPMLVYAQWTRLPLDDLVSVILILWIASVRETVVPKAPPLSSLRYGFF